MADATDEDGRSKRFWVLVAVVGLGLQVVLFAVVGAVAWSFVMGLGPAEPTSPTTAFGGDAGESYTLTHEGGDSLEPTRVAVLRNGEEVGTWAELSASVEAGEEVRAGDRIAVPDVEEGDRITVVWHGEDASSTMFEDEVGPLRTPIPTSKTAETPQRSSSTTGASDPKTATADSSSV